MKDYSFFVHPNSVCMSYFEHMSLSLGFSKTLMVASLKALIHAFLPNVYKRSTSDTHQLIGSQLAAAGCNRTA